MTKYWNDRAQKNYERARYSTRVRHRPCNYILELCGELVGENPRAMQRKENVLTTTQAGHNDTLIVMAVCQWQAKVVQIRVHNH